ncbi:MAG TPA: hypothetical protein VKZ18_08355 [Polyangia bacterium]|nr:hypothetical protein [Polyangia bacterium]
MVNRPRVIPLLALAVLAAGACGGKGEASGGAPPYVFATSVDGGVLLDDLTASQAAQLCADINAAADGGLETSYCRALSAAVTADETRMYLQDNPGTSTAALQAQCATFLSGQQSDGCPAAAATCDPTKIATGSSACTATVSDVVACINAYAVDYQGLLNGTPSCADVSPTSLSRYFADGGAFDTYNSIPTSASCTALLACPGIGPGL